MSDNDLTPVAPVAPAPITPSPAHAPSLSDAGSTWVSTPTQPRDGAGKFVAADSAPTTDAPTALPDPATTEPSPLAAADDPTLYLDAKVGAEVVRLRKDTLIPTLRNGQVEYEPLETVQRERMLKKDYDAKMVERKDMDRRLQARQVELEHRAAAFEREETRLREAQSDPAKWDQYQQHLQLMQENPQYRATFERAQQVEQYEARDAATRAVEEQAVIEDAVSTATAWIDEIVGRHPGVSVERVRERYSQELRHPDPRLRARFHPDDIGRIVAQEAAQVAATLSPLQTELATMKAKLAALEAASTTNGNTAHALARAGAVPTAPIGGAPPVPGRRELIPGGPKARDLDALGAAWAKGG